MELCLTAKKYQPLTTNYQALNNKFWDSSWGGGIRYQHTGHLLDSHSTRTGHWCPFGERKGQRQDSWVIWPSHSGFEDISKYCHLRYRVFLCDLKTGHFYHINTQKHSDLNIWTKRHKTLRRRDAVHNLMEVAIAGHLHLWLPSFLFHNHLTLVAVLHHNSPKTKPATLWILTISALVW